VETVLEVLAEVTGRERSELRPEMDLTTDLGLDSPNALRLLVELEERLDAEISDDEAAAMNTVGDILEYARSVS
jgi:acyl carrier protein